MRKDPNREKRVRSPDQTRTRVLAAERFIAQLGSVGILPVIFGESLKEGFGFGVSIWDLELEYGIETRDEGTMVIS